MSCVPGDYDDDPGRWTANQRSTARFSAVGDVHGLVAPRLSGRVLDIGGGDGTLARLLTGAGVSTVVVDRARHLVRAPRPVVFADARALPFPDATFDSAAALWMLYHLPDPLVALREARRVLRAGGLLAVSTSSRRNDPEFAAVLPGWGAARSFDAENGPGLLRQVFAEVEVQHWDVPVVRLPDRQAVALFLRGRGLGESRARAVAGRFATPMTVTKRGMLAWARVG